MEGLAIAARSGFEGCYWAGWMVRAERAEEELGAEKGQVTVDRQDGSLVVEVVCRGHAEGASNAAESGVLDGLDGGWGGVWVPDGCSI